MESSKTMRNVSKVSAHNPSHSSYTMPPPQIFIFMFYLKFLLISSVTPLVYSNTFTFVNNCTDHVWPGICTTMNAIKPSTSGFSLRPGETKVISVETNWNGRVWGRTLCNQNSTTGNFSCVTGDCGSNNLECSDRCADPPVTFAEFALNSSKGLDFYDVSLVDGYNLPMIITPQGGSGDSCENIGCAIDLKSECPPDLTVVAGGQEDVVACKSACYAYQEAKYCCTGNWTGDACRRNSYTAFFKIACPTTYSYAYDERNTTYTCAGADYLINFCPSPTTRLGQIQQHVSPTPSPKSGNDHQVNPPLNSSNQTWTNFSSKDVDGKIRRIIFISFPLVAILVLCLGVVFYLRKKKQKKAKKLSSLLRGSSHVKAQKEHLDLPLFYLRTISCATNNFASTNKLGQGGFGTVHKGVLKDGQEIAVKRLSKTSRQGLSEFKNEVTYIAKLQHRNLVKLLGCCIETDEIMLVYEFMPNKSLDYFIFDATLSTILDWPKRYNIINGIARGLQYLHQDSRLRIIHRDLKLSNVLLDQDMNPKISDFGLARCFGGNQTEANTKKVVGTYGYMSPEYQVDGVYSVKSDVFSFGVMVLEIVSGERNRGFTHPDHQLNLLGHAWRLHQEGRSLELIAEPAKASSSQSEILRTIQLGLLCVQRSPEDRPSMSSVVHMMSGESSLAQPKQPGFFTERELVEANVPSSRSNFRPVSLNVLSLSSLDPR